MGKPKRVSKRAAERVSYGEMTDLSTPNRSYRNRQKHAILAGLRCLKAPADPRRYQNLANGFACFFRFLCSYHLYLQIYRYGNNSNHILS